MNKPVNPSVRLENVDLSAPILGANKRSLRNLLIRGTRELGGETEERPTVQLLKNITLSLTSGDVLGVMGGNGSGKTSLLRLIGGLYAPTEGTRAVSGRISSMVDISLGLNPEATGHDNLRLRSTIERWTSGESIFSEKEIMEFTELGEAFFRPVKTYSSGMKMRLAFILAAEKRPDIMILDEWLSVGDESFKAKADDKLHSLLTDSQIAILASHSRELLEEKCSIGLVLRQGHIHFIGDITEATRLHFTSF